MKNLEACDYVVALLALIVCIITAGAIAGVLMRGQSMTEAQAEIMSQITSAIISIISMYVGASIQKKRDRD